MKGQHGTGRHCCAAACALILAAMLPRSGHAQPHVIYFTTEVSVEKKDAVLVRGAFDIAGGAERWYQVYFQLRLGAETPLKTKEGRDFVIRWGDVFTPAHPDPARYTDCRIDIAVKDIEASPNLPKGKRTTLWAMCDVWDTEDKKYLGAGWPTRAPLFVTTDKAGKIVKLESLNLFPFMLARNLLNPEKGSIHVAECKLKVKHLIPKPGVMIYRAVGLNKVISDKLFTDDVQAPVDSTSRGYFFDIINRPEKARELVELAFPNSAVINTPNQYEAIKNALRKRGWKDEHIPVPRPESFGVTVTEEPGMGYRVAALLVYYNRYQAGGYSDVLYCEYAVGEDGRLGEKRTVCIRGAQHEAARPPGWQQPVPATPAEYGEAIWSALIPGEWEVMPIRVAVTDTVATIPCAEGEPPEIYLQDVKAWPKEARQ